MKSRIYQRTYTSREQEVILEPHTPENYPARDDNIEKEIRRRCIELKPNKFLWYDSISTSLAYITIEGDVKHSQKGKYDKTIEVQIMPVARTLPKELSDLLAQKGFKLKQ